jgi:ABC-type Na+ transport system ATPase subunit NatA
MTGRELLTMFARLRGVPEKQIKEVVETKITRLDLKKYADKRCGNYRSVAISNSSYSYHVFCDIAVVETSAN